MIRHTLDTPAPDPTPDQLASLWRDLQEMAERNVQVTLFTGRAGAYKATAVHVFGDIGCGLHLQVTHPTSLLAATSELVRMTRHKWPFPTRPMPQLVRDMFALKEARQRAEWLDEPS